MTDHRQSDKASDAPSPPQAEAPAPTGAARRTSKSYEDLLHGFEEIRKIVINQEEFDKLKSNANNYDEIVKGFDKIKKIVDDHENQGG